MDTDNIYDNYEEIIENIDKKYEDEFLDFCDYCNNKEIDISIKFFNILII